MPKCLQQAGQDLISLDTELPQNIQFPCRKNKKKEGLGVHTPSVCLALSSLCFSGREAASSAHVCYLFKLFHLLPYSLFPQLLSSFFDFCPGCGLTTPCSSAATLLLCALVPNAPRTHPPACLCLLSGPGTLPLSCTGINTCAGQRIREPAQNKNKIMTGRQGQVLKNGLVA